MKPTVPLVQARAAFGRILAEALSDLDESEMRSLVRWAQKSHDLRLTMAAKELAAALKPPRKRRAPSGEGRVRGKPPVSDDELQAFVRDLQNALGQTSPIDLQGIQARLSRLTVARLKPLAAELGFQLPSKGTKGEKIARLTDWLQNLQDMRRRADF